MKLHIGCGAKYLAGFIHVDAQKHSHIDILCNVFDLLDHVKPNSVQEIYACHIVEHVSRNRISELFDIFYTVLAPGGLLRISVPDLEKSIQLYTEGRYPLYPSLYGQFWGGQRNEYDYHTCGFDFKTMRHFMDRAGFCDLERYDWRTFLPEGYDDYSRSYLPHMDFENGELLSLNVIATKCRPLLALCVGGFANAINSVIASCDFAKRHKMKLFVHWVENYIANDAKFTEIFDIVDDSSITLIDESQFQRMLSIHQDSILKVVHNAKVPQFARIPGHFINPKPLTDIDASLLPLLSTYNLMAFHTDALPLYVQNNPRAHFERFFSIVQFAKRIVDKANAAFDSFPNPKPSIGLHLRGTDILVAKGYAPNDLMRHAVSIANANPAALPIMVCTDDRAVYDSLVQDTTRFVMCDHEAYVTRRDPRASWFYNAGPDHINCSTIAHENKEYKAFSSANVYRPLSQIEAGIIDLILLSRMSSLECFHPTSHGSTYFDFARFLQNYIKDKVMSQ